MNSAQAPTRVGGFRLTGLLGTGGFAATYAASSSRGEPVAVKVLAPNWSSDVDIAIRFEAECEKLADAAELIGNDRYAVPRYISHGRDGDALYLVTELCDGGSLAQRMPIGSDHNPSDRLGGTAWVLAEAARCVSVVHDRLDVVHRDLSPGNLLFRTVERRKPEVGRGGAQGEELVVADFGLMKEAALQSNFSRVVGTLAYGAPEVRRRGVCDSRSDVYSLGVVATELLTGRRPTAGSDEDADDEAGSGVVAAWKDDAPPSTPGEVVDIVAEMLADEREARPTLAEVLGVFAPLATGPPPARGAVTSALPGRRRRRKVIGAAIAGVAIAAVVLAGAAFVALRPDGGDDFQFYAPPDAGYSVALGSGWTDIDEDPEGDISLAAFHEEHQLVMLVAPAVVPDAQTAAERALSVMADTASDIESSVLEDGKILVTFSESNDTATRWYFLPLPCGSISMRVIGPDPLPTDTVRLIDEMASRFTSVPVVALPGSGDAVPDGYLRVARNGVSLVVPDEFLSIESADACLTAIDTRENRPTASVSVSLNAGGEAADLISIYETVWADQDGQILDRSEAADGSPRRHVVFPDGRQLLVRFVGTPKGVYVVETVELDGERWDDTGLGFWDDIADSLEDDA